VKNDVFDYSLRLKDDFQMQLKQAKIFGSTVDSTDSAHGSLIIFSDGCI